MKDDPTSIRRKLRELENIRLISKILLRAIDNGPAAVLFWDEANALRNALDTYNPEPKGKRDD